MNEKETLGAIKKLANRLFEIDKKLNGDNAMDIVEYNLIVEEIFRMTEGVSDEKNTPKSKKIN